MKSCVSLTTMKLMPVAVVLMTSLTLQARTYEFTEGKYVINYDDQSGVMNVQCDGRALFSQVYAETVYNLLGSSDDRTIDGRELKATVSREDATDCFGEGVSYVFSYDDGTATMRQHFNFYPDRSDYFIVYNTVESNDGSTVLQSRHMVPLATEGTSQPFNGTKNRVLWVPYDNDGHGRYHNYSMVTMTESESISPEVSAAYDGDSRYGLVAGSVDHDKWKSSVQIFGDYGLRLKKFRLLSGYADYNVTRDALPHGKVKGQTIASARYMVGMFADWREGMNTFADCNVAVAPRLQWDHGNPVGWSTYGVMQERVNYSGVVETGKFMYDNFYDKGFHDSRGLISMSFDAFGDSNISHSLLKYMINNEFEPRNMVMGMYAGFLCSWEWALDAIFYGTNTRHREACLKVNGGEYYKVPSSNCVALDPTHPAIKQHIEAQMAEWANWGVRYVKLDFVNGGQCEADSWYDPEITTGTMAYNYGMKIVAEAAQRHGIYVVLAMSPMFPYQYAHGRRTCCDRMSRIDETEYVMNATSWGWWTDRLYTVNDPDQLVLVGRNNHKSETIGENRARATSGMTTGAYIWGDNFSTLCRHTDEKEAAKQGVSVGDPVGWVDESRERALQIMSNEEINEYVRTHTGSFMPAYGNDFTNTTNGSDQQSERLFVRHDGEYTYVAAFSFSRTQAYVAEVNWSRLGVNGAQVAGIKELWTGEAVGFNSDLFRISVPAADARVYKISYTTSGIDDVTADANDNSVQVEAGAGCISVNAASSIASVDVYTVEGCMLCEAAVAGNVATAHTGGFTGPAIVRVILKSGDSVVRKVLVK